MPTVSTREATAADLPLVHQTLYLALSWDPTDPIPPIDRVIAHPEVARYHERWMRPGDAGVVAETDGAFAGMAYYRLFTAGNHGQGYVDPQTPELAVGVVAEHRGKGIGSRLMDELADVARSTGIERISLSVSRGNPAARLYERLGYVYASQHDPELLVLNLG